MNQEDLNKVREELFNKLDSQNNEEIQNCVDTYMEKFENMHNFNNNAHRSMKEESYFFAETILDINDSNDLSIDNDKTR